LIDAAARLVVPAVRPTDALGAPPLLRAASERFAGALTRAGDAFARDAEWLSRGLRLSVDGFADADSRLAGVVAG
jgi:hypothetical protein